MDAEWQSTTHSNPVESMLFSCLLMDGQVPNPTAKPEPKKELGDHEAIYWVRGRFEKKSLQVSEART